MIEKCVLAVAAAVVSGAAMGAVVIDFNEHYIGSNQLENYYKDYGIVLENAVIGGTKENGGFLRPGFSISFTDSSYLAAGNGLSAITFNRHAAAEEGVLIAELIDGTTERWWLEGNVNVGCQYQTREECEADGKYFFMDQWIPYQL